MNQTLGCHHIRARQRFHHTDETCHAAHPEFAERHPSARGKQLPALPSLPQFKILWLCIEAPGSPNSGKERALKTFHGVAYALQHSVEQWSSAQAQV